MKQHLYNFSIIILLCLLLFQCNRNIVDRRIAKANTDALTDSVKHYKNNLNGQTATIKTLQLSEQQLYKTILDKDQRLKTLTQDFTAINNIVKTESTTTIDTIKIILSEPIPVPDSLEFARAGSVNTKWYNIGYKITKDSLTITPFITWTATTVITGFKRKWVLGKQTLVTDITHDNPYIKTTHIKAAEVTLSEPWYRKWYFWMAVGITGGLIIK